MIELVIPSLWKAEKFHTMLPKYTENPYISRIHIMDNGLEFSERYPNGFPPKWKIYTPPSYNKWYINEAWNIGVAASSQNSIVGVLNDDIEFNTDIFEWIVENSSSMGILGMHQNNYKLEQDETFEIVEIPQHMHGWGCMFFFDKRNWSIIPPQLKLYFGDTWQFHMNDIPCKALKGLSMKESNISATTARSEFFEDFNQKYIFERSWFMQNVQQQNYNLGHDRIKKLV